MKVDIHIKINITPEELLALKGKKEKLGAAIEKLIAEVEKKQMLDEIVNRILSEAGIEVKEDNEEQEHCSDEDFKNYLKIRDEEPWKIYGISEQQYREYKSAFSRLKDQARPKNVSEAADWLAARTARTFKDFVELVKNK